MRVRAYTNDREEKTIHKSRNLCNFTFRLFLYYDIPIRRTPNLYRQIVNDLFKLFLAREIRHVFIVIITLDRFPLNDEYFLL